MIYKLFLEEGLYQDKDTKEVRNLLEGEIAYTPEGINVGWTELENLETALEYFNLELVPEPEEEDEE
jgi:hypothetical protein